MNQGGNLSYKRMAFFWTGKGTGLGISLLKARRSPEKLVLVYYRDSKEAGVDECRYSPIPWGNNYFWRVTSLKRELIRIEREDCSFR